MVLGALSDWDPGRELPQHWRACVTSLVPVVGPLLTGGTVLWVGASSRVGRTDGDKPTATEEPHRQQAVHCCALLAGCERMCVPLL